MKESLANSYVFSVILVIVGICSSLIIVSMNYSKVFKMKNRVIEIIEKHGTYNNTTVMTEIDNFLRDAGYPPRQTTDKCPKGRGTSGSASLSDSDAGVDAINTLKNYKYCIYKFNPAKGSYYSVVLYMNLEFPLIGEFIKLELPMYGDTKIIFDY